MKKAHRKNFESTVNKSAPRRCPLVAGPCNLNRSGPWPFRASKRVPFAFIMRPYAAEFQDMEDISSEVLKSIGSISARNMSPGTVPEAGTQARMACVVAKDESYVGAGLCQICELCQYAHFGIGELTGLNPNVVLEVGLMFALAKPVVLTLNTARMGLSEIPFDFTGLLLVTYRNTKELREGLKGKVTAVMAELRGRKLL